MPQKTARSTTSINAAPEWFWSVGTLFCLALAYGLAAPQTLPDMDSGEFVGIALSGGIAHPPGYPLYSLLLRATAALNQIAGGAALITWLSWLSILCTLIAATLAQKISRELTGSAIAAAAATWIIFLAAPVWRVATTIEPFALNLLLSAVVSFCGWRLLTRESEGGSQSSYIWSGLLGCAFALGFCNHHSQVLLVPGAAWVLLRQVVAAPAMPQRVKVLGMFVLGFGLGLLPLIYFFLPIVPPAFVWGDWTDFSGNFWHHVLRRGYGTFTLAPGAAQSWTVGEWHFIEELVFGSAILGLPLALWGLASDQSVPKSRQRFIWFCVLSFLLAGPGFVALFKMGSLPWEQAVIERFFALPLLLLVPLLARGLVYLQRLPVMPRLVPVLLVIVGLSQPFLQWSKAERRSEQFYETHLYNIAKLLDSGSVLITTSDPDFSGDLYLRARHTSNLHRTIYAGLLGSGWYDLRVSVDYDLPLPVVRGGAERVIEALATRYKVYLLNIDGQVLKNLTLATYPWGPLIRVLPPGEQPLGPVALFQENQRLYDEVLTLPTAEAIVDAKIWDMGAMELYARPWESLIKPLEDLGHKDLTDAAKNRAAFYKPVLESESNP